MRASIAVLDISVLELDPGALFRLGDETLFLPAAVVELLETGVRALDTERARNLRTAAAFLESLLAGAESSDIESGIPIPGSPAGASRLFFPQDAPGGPKASHGDRVLAAARAARAQSPDSLVTVVSADAGLRVRARLSGLAARDSRRGQVLEDATLLYRGIEELPPDADISGANGSGSRDEMRVSVPRRPGWLPNQCLFREGTGAAELIVRKPQADGAWTRPARSFHPDAEPAYRVFFGVSGEADRFS